MHRTPAFAATDFSLANEETIEATARRAHEFIPENAILLPKPPGETGEIVP